MNTIKQALVALVGLAMMFAATSTFAAQPLKVGFAAEPYPPFSYKSSDGNWTGFEIELANKVCEQIGRECTHSPTSWSGIIPALNSGKIDMIFNSLSITKKRDKVVDFTRPYYKTGGAYVARKDMDLQLPEGLDGKIVGVQSSTTHANYARSALSDTGAQFKYYNKQEQANRDLLAGRVDVILADQIAMAKFVERDSVSDYEMKATTPPDPAYGKGIGIAVRESDGKLRKQLNDAIAALIANGQCEKLSRKYFDQNICVDSNG